MSTSLGREGFGQFHRLGFNIFRELGNATDRDGMVAGGGRGPHSRVQQAGIGQVARGEHPGKAAVSPESASRKTEPVYVDGVSFTVVDGPAGGKELRYEGNLHNNSANAVDGVELSISLVNANKASIGGQVTQYFFQPSVPPQGSQAMLVQLPA